MENEINGQKFYKIYNIKNYFKADNNFIKNNYEEFKLKDIKNQLKKYDNNYHFRISNNSQYIFFGDIDYYFDDIKIIIELLKKFMATTYNLDFKDNEFKYTKNNKKNGCYHYSIPKWNASTEKLKEIHTKFLKEYNDKLTFNDNGKIKSCIDTSIYSNHWFRCPNQSKGQSNKKDEILDGKHIIINGKMKNFIVEYIPSKSENINKIIEIENKIENKMENNNKIIEMENKIENITEEKNQMILYSENKNIFSTSITRPELYKNLFDECYKQNRFEEYQYWMAIGMAIKNTFNDDEEAIELFNYFSAKGSNYEGFDKTKKKYDTYTKKVDSGYSAATIYHYAREDNLLKFAEIMSKNTFELGQTDVCKYLKTIAGHKFIYKKIGDHYKLYCYNNQYWQSDDIIMRRFIGYDLYHFLRTVLVDVYWNSKEFNCLKLKIEKLKTISYKKDIIEGYKEIGIDNKIVFDEKWKLLAFTNKVYDMEEEKFRNHCYDDYISMTTGYDWREPTAQELDTMNRLITTIMPIEEERNLYLQILCTTLDGRCLEKFIIFNGSGGNGKGMIDDILLLALGNYALIGNNAILFETSKTGSNSEKANMHKKRLVLLREPPERNKFQNSIIKELTGGGTFSARNLYEKETEKELNSTIIIECNKKPLFAEDPTDADARRIIDLQFRSTFTDNEQLLDEKNHIFLANTKYKEKEFQQQHKYALLKILMNEHHKYYKINKSKLIVPESVENRTRTYLELSCNIVQWFKDNYEQNNENVCKLKDVFDEFTKSEYYSNLNKMEKRKYNKTYFIDYFQTNIFLKKYFFMQNSVYSIKGWTLKNNRNENTLNKYNVDVYSKISIEWLNYLSKELNINIQHAENGGEYKIKNSLYKADGFCKELNLIFEFDGCKFHGCVKCNKNSSKNNNLLTKTLKKKKYCTNNNFNYLNIWQCYWDEIKNNTIKLNNYIAEINNYITSIKNN
jgi:phage/plasmid-associated DNA primase